jgi:glycine betaine/proline transport system permease protein
MPDIPVGDWIDAAIQWSLQNFGPLFDAISAALLTLTNIVYRALAAPHAYLLIAILAAIAAVVSRRVGLVVFTILAFLLIDGMGLWVESVQTLAVVIVAATLAIVIGIPFGIFTARNEHARVIMRPLLDFMQTLPVFVYLIPAVFFFGIGVVPGAVATTVFAIPPAVRLTELGIRQVDSEVVEAAQAFGSRPRQILRDVQIPLAMPSIMAGINQVIMLALSMVVIAGMVGAAGLGAIVVRGVTELDIGAGFEGGLAVVILAVYLDRVTDAAGGYAERRRRGRSHRPRSRRRGGATEAADTATEPTEAVLVPLDAESRKSA